MSAKSRCDVCERRIGPARYELGLCPQCEAMAQLMIALEMTGIIYLMTKDPTIAQEIGKRGRILTDVLQALQARKA